MAGRLRPRGARSRPRRRAHAGRVRAAGRDRRRVARRPAARDRSVRVSVRRPRVLAVLQLARDGRVGHVGNLTADRRDARHDRRRGSVAARDTRRVHGAARRAARLCRVRLPCRHRRRLLFRDRARRLQGGRRVCPREHAAAQALRIRRRPRRLLGRDGTFPARPGTDQPCVADDRRRCARAPDRRQDRVPAPARRAVRAARQHRGHVAVPPRSIRRHPDRRRPARAAAPFAARGWT